MIKKAFLIIGVIFGILICGTLGYFFIGQATPAEQVSYGVTFSARTMRDFDLDPKEALAAILDDLGVRKIRLIAFWDEIERDKDVYDFSDLDWQILEASEKEAKIILALGQKVPRWPECHLPAWARELSEEPRNKEALEYITEIVKRYQGNPQIIIWQIENEPFFFRSFGDCAEYDSKVLDQEISLVRSLDSRPIMVTSSGELSLWVGEFRRGDIFGTSLYKYVYNRFVGYMRYHVPAIFYQRKVALMRFLFGDKPVIVCEQQAEPWTKTDLKTTPKEEVAQTMTLEKFQEIIDYSRQCGFDDVYLWGVEWWYWRKEAKNDAQYWEFAKTLF